MAELHVEPKRKSPWWLWLLIALAIIGLLYYFLRDRGTSDTGENQDTDRDTTGQTTALIIPSEGRDRLPELNFLA